MGRISVITPAFNSASFIRETVQSVQSQTFTDWEMIIVDDCSSDDTYKIVMNLADDDPRIRVLQNKTNTGSAAARNRALDFASGEYIAFLDSDDLWLPQKLEKQIQFMDAGNYTLTYTNYQIFDSVTGERRQKIIRAPATMTAEQIYSDTSIGCLTVMVNRNRSGPFHMPLIKHTEDNITWQQILERGFTGYRLDEVLSLYREVHSPLHIKKIKAAKQQWQTYRQYYRFSTIKSARYFSQYAFHAVKKLLF